MAGRNIGSKDTLLLKSKILGLVRGRERVAHHFELSTESVSVSFVITGQVVHGLSVTNKNGLAGLHGLSLTLHTEVRVNRVDDPGSNIMIGRVNTGFLLAGLR